jgi:hypothetical protein
MARGGNLILRIRESVVCRPAQQFDVNVRLQTHLRHRGIPYNAGTFTRYPLVQK